MKSLIGGLRGLFARTTSLPNVSTRSGFGITRTAPAPSESNLRAFSSVGTLFAIVDRTAQSVAAVDWKLYRKTSDGRRRYEGQDTRIEVTRHAALDLWNSPNRFMTRQELVESCQQHLSLVGEGWISVGRSDLSSIPLELFPVRPDRMRPVPHATEYLAGYIYKTPDGTDQPLGLNEVLFIRRPNPLDPYRGIGPVQSILADIDSVRYSTEWNRNFFYNGAEPGGIVQFPEGVSDDDWRTFTARFGEQHRGVANAHRIAVLEHGAEYKEIRYNHQNMQFAELQTVSREVIREAFGFPKSMLGSVEDVNRANALQGEIAFARWTVISELNRWKAMLNNDLLPLFGTAGQGLEFDYVSPVPEDRGEKNDEFLTRATAAKIFIEAGFDSTDVLKYLEIPDMRFVGKAVPDGPPAIEPAV